MKDQNTTPLATSTALANSDAALTDTRYGVEKVQGIDIFFREAGDPANPAIVLLHGYPSSSHQYRNLIRHLSDTYYLIAPDYPGFGNSGHPDRKDFAYTFDNLAKVVDGFLEQRKIHTYSLMIQDFGAPVGFRIATRHPERVQSFIIQNGNAYIEGMSQEAWVPVRAYWKDRSEDNEKALDPAFTMEGLKWEYTHGTRNPESINPDNWQLDYVNHTRPGVKQIMLDLFYDYQTNVELYPEWQAYLREHQPPALIVWGANDAYFPTPGAEGYRRDLKDVDYNILNTGHFALEEDHRLVAEKARAFLGKRVR